MTENKDRDPQRFSFEAKMAFQQFRNDYWIPAGGPFRYIWAFWVSLGKAWRQHLRRMHYEVIAVVFIGVIVVLIAAERVFVSVTTDLDWPVIWMSQFFAGILIIFGWINTFAIVLIASYVLKLLLSELQIRLPAIIAFLVTIANIVLVQLTHYDILVLRLMANIRPEVSRNDYLGFLDAVGWLFLLIAATYPLYRLIVGLVLRILVLFSHLRLADGYDSDERISKYWTDGQRRTPTFSELARGGLSEFQKRLKALGFGQYQSPPLE